MIISVYRVDDKAILQLLEDNGARTNIALDANEAFKLARLLNTCVKDLDRIHYANSQLAKKSIEI